MGHLDDLDLTLTLTRKQESAELKLLQTRMQVLRLWLGGQLSGELGPALCVVFEGWDASGKGGCIKRLVAPLDPRHVRVTQWAAPTHDQKRHHFLWRFWPALPGWGGMAVFDRSWYGRVLVERVEGFAAADQWERAYEEIRGFEAGLVEEGMILVKFWLHLSPEEQLRRFAARRTDPLKAFKLTDEDWRNRERWDEYSAAVDRMIDETDREGAKWHAIAADSKRFARVEVLRHVIEDAEAGLERAGIAPPPSYEELQERLLATADED